jgi:hypothetical protein
MISIPDNIFNNETPPDQNTLSQDVVFDLLSSSRRRFVLYYLRTETESVKLTDLSDEVAAWEYETPIEELTEQERKRAYVSLYQTHVPKLVEAGLIDHDTDSGMLRLTDRMNDIDGYLLNDTDPDIRWELIYVFLSVIGVVMFSIGLSNASVFSAISIEVAGWIVLLSFSGTAIAHFITSHRQKQRIPLELSNGDDYD